LPFTTVSHRHGPGTGSVLLAILHDPARPAGRAEPRRAPRPDPADGTPQRRTTPTAASPLRRRDQPARAQEQRRIEGMLTDIDQRLSVYRAGREDAMLRLRAYLHRATTAHAFYLACDDARRRLGHQAFFTKITLNENLDVSSEL